MLIVDGDGQHRPADAQRLVATARRVRPRRRRAIVGDAGQHRAARRQRALNWLASYLTEREIPDLTSGFRAARRECLLEFLHLLPNGFSTPTTTTLAFLKAGYNVAFEPIDAGSAWARRRSSSRATAPKFFLIMLQVVTIFSPLRVFLPISVGVLRDRGRSTRSGRSATQSHVTNSSVLLIMFAVVVFLVGLVSEQISALRFEGRQ